MTVEIAENVKLTKDYDLVLISGYSEYGYEYEAGVDKEESIQLIRELLRMHEIKTSEI